MYKVKLFLSALVLTFAMSQPTEAWRPGPQPYQCNCDYCPHYPWLNCWNVWEEREVFCHEFYAWYCSP